jgi:PTS system fructose-specific IIC component
MAKIAAVTGCPTGIAHTIMAAEALKKTSEVMGHEIQVETQGSEGAKNVLSENDIAAADVVIISSDIHIEMTRFAGKPMVAVTTSDAIRKTKAVIEEALAEVAEAKTPPAAKEEPVAPPPAVRDVPKRLVAVTSCPTGIAHTFMAAEALRKAATALGHEIKVETQGSVGAKNVLTPEEIEKADAVIIAADAYVDKLRFAGKRLYETSTKEALHNGVAGVEAALALPEPKKTDYVGKVKQLKKARSTTRTGPYKHLMTEVSYMLPVVVAGGLLIALAFAFGGIYAQDAKGTFGWALMQIGGATAFALFVPVLAGFIAYSIADRPGLTPGLIGGMLATTVGAGFLGGIVAGFIAGYLTQFLNAKIQLPENLQGLKPVLILPLTSTLIVGLLMIYVIGPPVKVAMTGLETWLVGLQQGSALVLGISFITEGAIPYAARDPFRVIPSIMAGAAVAGALSMVFGVQLLVPHGGVFVLLIPNAVTHLLLYILAIAVGTVVTAGVLYIVKKPVLEINGQLADAQAEAA